MNRKSIVRFKADAGSIGEDGTFSGYGSVFGVVDSYGDIVLPGAFKASLETHTSDGSMPALLWQHLPEEPIGVWTEMREDERGLYCKGRLLTDVTRGREALALLRAGALNGLSIGYEVTGEEPIEAIEEKYGLTPPETAVRALSSVALWEVSLVTFPACTPAQVHEVRRSPRARRASLHPPGVPALLAALEARKRLLARI